MSECDETYKECVAARKARVKEVLKTAKPGDTEEALAAKAKVHRNTIVTAKKQSAQVCADCNTPPRRVKTAELKSLYQNDDYGQDEDGRTVSPEMELGFRPTVVTIERALDRCSYAELAYVICNVIPVFKGALERHYLKGVKRDGTATETDGSSQNNHPAHGAG